MTHIGCEGRKIVGGFVGLQQRIPTAYQCMVMFWDFKAWL